MFGRGKHEMKLLDAAWAGDEATIKQVLTTKTDLVNVGASRGVCRQRSDFHEGDTALHLAAVRGHRGVVDFLFSLKASARVAASNGVTALHCAAKGGHHQIVNMLLERGANVNTADAAGRTPLHEAAIGGHPEVQQALASAGADSNVKDREGNTALHEAARACSEPLVRLLAANGANLNDTNNQQRTPLHVAILSADHSAESHVNRQRRGGREATTQLVKLLLSLGADPNALDARGETPLDLLSYLEGGEAGTDPLVNVLREAGGKWVRYGHRHTADEAPATADETIVGVETSKRRSSSPASFQTAESGGTGRVMQLGDRPITIGRSVECELRFRSLTMSRRHARIERHGSGYAITDLGSHNGTVVDGERITRPHVLEGGEIITLGAYEFEFDGQSLSTLQGELSEEALASERQRP